MDTYAQDVDAHLFYDVDWSKWLLSRGYNAGEIVSVTWIVPATITKTLDSRTGAVARAYFKNPTLNKKSVITCRLEMPNTDGGGETVKDDFSFAIMGKPK
jgi:hypothetical protein